MRPEQDTGAGAVNLLWQIISMGLAQDASSIDFPLVVVARAALVRMPGTQSELRMCTRYLHFPPELGQRGCSRDLPVPSQTSSQGLAQPLETFYDLFESLKSPVPWGLTKVLLWNGHKAGTKWLSTFPSNRETRFIFFTFSLCSKLLIY